MPQQVVNVMELIVLEMVLQAALVLVVLGNVVISVTEKAELQDAVLRVVATVHGMGGRVIVVIAEVVTMGHKSAKQEWERMPEIIAVALLIKRLIEKGEV